MQTEVLDTTLAPETVGIPDLPEPYVPRAHPLNLLDHLGRLYASYTFHKLLPDRVAMALARGLGHAVWLWPPARRRAIGRMSLTLAGTGRESELRALARDSVIIDRVRREMTMRPWMSFETPVEGGQNLHDAVATGRPVILVGSHIGWGTVGVSYVLGYRNLVSVSLPWLAPPDGRLPRGVAGHFAMNTLELAKKTGYVFLPSGGSYPVLRGVLERRQLCLLMVDVPGDFMTRMGGKNAYLRTGTARLACETDALVVPIVGLLRRDGPDLRVLEPIDAATVGGREELLDRLASIYGEVVLNDPASVQQLPWMRNIWRDEGADYPLELWMPRRLVHKAHALGRHVSAAVRVRLRRLKRS